MCSSGTSKAPDVAWCPVEPRADPVAPGGQPAVTRRTILTVGLTGISGAALTGCSSSPSHSPSNSGSPSHETQGPSHTPSSSESPSQVAGQDSPTTTSAADPPGPPAVALTSGPDITHGPTAGHQVALTFHGQGPVGMAHEILDACAGADAAVTVFAVGTWLAQNPRIGAEIVAAGHELGNHTWSHQQMKQLTRAQAVDEAVRGARALEAAVGSPGWWFRPSGTQHSTSTIRAAAGVAGYHRCVSYDVDPEDFRDPGATAVHNRTLTAVRPGSIVSLHFGHRGTVDALPGILAGLRTKGLQAVTLSTLLRSL